MSLRGGLTSLALFLVLLLAKPVGADTYPGYEDPFGSHGDLTFPSQPDPAPAEKQGAKMTTALYRPAGDGPFPALIVMPNCGGVSEADLVWAAKAVASGYVAFIVDPFRPRNVNGDCIPPLKVSWPRRLKDAFDAAAHLRTLPFVIPDKIALIGSSAGGMTGLEAASTNNGRYSRNHNFAAIVSLYPYCYVPQTKRRFLPAAVASPLLVMMGDLDNETPPKDCIERLSELKKAGLPVEWELYKNATHCWDCIQYKARGLRKRDWKGDVIEYRYNESVAAASTQRAFSFLAKAMSR